MTLTQTPTGMTTDLGTVNAIDFVNIFTDNVNRLREALGITRMQPLTKGNSIDIYKWTVTKPGSSAQDDGYNGIVNPGVTIPLTSVKKEVARTIQVDWHKYRKEVPVEMAQKYGYQEAIVETDKQVLGQMHKDIRSEFFTTIAGTSGATNITSTPDADLQAAIATAWGQVMDKFDGNADQIVMFVNPLDAAKYLGAAAISNGKDVSFGLTLLETFAGVRLIINNSVPQGSYYATAVNNLNLAYVPANDGEIAAAMAGKNIITDELGLVAIASDSKLDNLTAQTVVFDAMKLFPEVIDGVVIGKIQAPAAAAASTASK